jgi:hypothetical protein
MTLWVPGSPAGKVIAPTETLFRNKLTVTDAPAGTLVVRYAAKNVTVIGAAIGY